MSVNILTGDRPSGRLHLGHYVGSLKNRVILQDSYKQFIMVADLQALTDNYENPKKVTSNIYEVVKDYLSVGIDPSKSTIFIQSQIPEISELTIYYLNLVNFGRLVRNPTLKEEIKLKGLSNNMPLGFVCYPINQAADITIFKASLVPVGNDQIPMIEQTNEIVRRFNKIYNTNCLKECAAYLSNSPRLVGIDGKHKASKSLENAIFLSSSPEQLKQKIFQMYTDPNHIKVSDPGRVKGNVVFHYLDAFYLDKEELLSLKKHYQRGGLGDVTIKDILYQTLSKLLDPIRQSRMSFSNNYVRDIILSGSLEARKVAAHTMEMVRNAIGVNYF